MGGIPALEDRKGHLNLHKIETNDYARDFLTKTTKIALVSAFVGVTTLFLAYCGYQKLSPIVQDYLYPTQPQIQGIGTDLDNKIDSLIQ